MDAADVAHAAHIIGHLGQAVTALVNHESGDAFGLQILDQPIVASDLGVDKGHRSVRHERLGGCGAIGCKSGQALAVETLNVGCDQALHQSRLGRG